MTSTIILQYILWILQFTLQMYSMIICVIPQVLKSTWQSKHEIRVVQGHTHTHTTAEMRQPREPASEGGGLAGVSKEDGRGSDLLKDPTEELRSYTVSFHHFLAQNKPFNHFGLFHYL